MKIYCKSIAENKWHEIEADCLESALKIKAASFRPDTLRGGEYKAVFFSPEEGIFEERKYVFYRSDVRFDRIG